MSLELSGFRGFSRSQAFDLDADSVVVVGMNGQGKTSLFDGILWALSGRIPRLRGEDSRVVSIYSETGQARAELRLRDPEGSQFTVTRSFDGTERRVALEGPKGTCEGPTAEGQLIELICPDAALSSDPPEALASVLTHSVYLQQDLIRQFVEAATPQERFTSASELVGAGRVTELQAGLERAKKAWSTATNQRENEVRPMRERLAVLEARLSESLGHASQAAPAIATEDWSRWWKDLAEVGLPAAQVDAGSREAPAAIDDAIKRLEALRRSNERRLESLRVVQIEATRLLNTPMPELLTLRERAASLRSELDEARRLVSEEQLRLSEARRLEAASNEQAEQVRALASLALKLLNDRCPVCGQEYDKAATRKRLEETAKSARTNLQAPRKDRLQDLLAALEAKENEDAAAKLALRSADQVLSERQRAQQSLRARLNALGIDADEDAAQDSAVSAAITEAEQLTGRIGQLQHLGESFALRLAHSSAVTVIDELRRETDTLRRETASRDKDIADRNRTGDRAQSVIEALREAASGVVEERLREIGPLLQNIYARIDPHPTFRAVTFLSEVVRGHGRLSTVLSDPIEDKQCDVPAVVLSSSQINALGVSVFLALNIGIGNAPLSVAMLDDPLQSLDDINLLGLVDLFRRAMRRRQLLVSTHDAHFGALLARKLRPSRERHSALVIELEGWGRQGPTVRTRSVEGDPAPLRLVASQAG
ncbi:MAG: AAA family ATPase [Candidatus Binatales bacterium]